MTKAKILKVGTIDDNNIAPSLSGWVFELDGKSPGITLNDDGTILVAGYTIEDLRDYSVAQENADRTTIQ